MLLVTFKRAFSDVRIRQCYLTLKVGRNAKPDEIKTQFLQLSKTHHPDNLTSGGHGKFLRLKEAYEIIKDAPLRKVGPRVQQLDHLHKPKPARVENEDVEDELVQDLSHRSFISTGGDMCYGTGKKPYRQHDQLYNIGSKPHVRQFLFDVLMRRPKSRAINKPECDIPHESEKSDLH